MSVCSSTEEGSKDGVPLGWRKDAGRRGAARSLPRDAGPALLPSVATRLVPTLRRRELVVCAA